MNLIKRIEQRRKINRAIRELSGLSNETLKDIGIERGNITEVVESAMREDADRAFTQGATRPELRQGKYRLASEGAA